MPYVAPEVVQRVKQIDLLTYGYLALVSIAGLVVSVVIQKRGKRRSS